MRRWSAIAVATIGVALVLGHVGLPTSPLFGALGVGVVFALARGESLAIPRLGTTAAQALIGVALGAEIQASTLKAVGAEWFGLTVVIVGTVAVSVAAGLVISSMTGVSRETGLLGLVAGGATAIISMSDELGADGRLVAFMQYLRVLVIVLLAPMVAYFLLTGNSDAVSESATTTSLSTEVWFTAVCCLVGLLFARLIRITAGSLLGPLLVASVISASGLVDAPGVPALLEFFAFAVIGLQVGLRFTYATITEARRLLVPVSLAILFLVLASATLAVSLAIFSNVRFADAYLATTPGGLYAVLAASIGTGADTTFIVSVQVLRVLVIVLAAPPIIRLLTRNNAEPVREGYY